MRCWRWRRPIQKKTSKTAHAALLLTAALWSLNGPLIKLLDAQGGGLDAIAIAFYRSLLGGLCFAPLGWRRRRALRRAKPIWVGASVLMFTAMTSTLVAAMTMTTAANAIILQYTAPVWVAVLSPFLLKERMRTTEAAAMTAAMTGVAVLFFGNPVSHRSAMFVALLSGLFFGLLLISLRALRHTDPFAVVALNTLGSALLMAPAVFLFGSFAFGPAQFGLLILLGFIQFSLPYAIYSWASKRIKAHRASLIVLMEAVFTPAMTFLTVGETFPLATSIGGVFIVVGAASALFTVKETDEIAVDHPHLDHGE